MNMQHLSGLANMGESSEGSRGKEAPRPRPALRRREISLPDVTYCGTVFGDGDSKEAGSGGEPWDNIPADGEVAAL